MRGQILGVDARTGEGLVSGDDGQRYRFDRDDWADGRSPAVGLRVDFESSGARALNVLPLPGAVASASAALGSDRNKLVAAVLAFFIGTLGIHRFYLGRTGSGVVMLILSLTFVGLFVTVPWSLIDMVRYLVMSDAEFAHRYARRVG